LALVRARGGTLAHRGSVPDSQKRILDFEKSHGARRDPLLSPKALRIAPRAARREAPKHDPHRAKPHLLAKQQLSCAPTCAGACTQTSLSSADHACGPDDTVFLRGFGVAGVSSG